MNGSPHSSASRCASAASRGPTAHAYPLFKQDDALKALFLLTPLCTETGDDGNNAKLVGEQNYPGFAALTRPVMFLLGNVDPACSVPMLYDFARNTKGNTSIVAVGGDHSLLLGRDEDGFTGRNAANLSAATSMIVQWANLVLEK